MNQPTWRPVRRIFCERTQTEVELLELDDGHPDYAGELDGERTRPLQRCQLGQVCNREELKCRWSYLNPDYDPFASQEPGAG